MSASLTPASRYRHKWLDRLIAAPAEEYGTFIAGLADIPPYERADAPDAALQMFGALPEIDPARAALEQGLLAWLEVQRTTRPSVAPGEHQYWVRQISESFEIVSLLELPQAAVRLRRNRRRWEDVAARHVIAPSRDMRAALWRMLALTQGLAHAADPTIPAAELVPLWHLICREAGGQLPPHYLPIGLLGLRRLPDGAITEAVPWLAGLAHWALARNTSEPAFKAQWLGLKRLYPGNPTQQREAVAALLATKQFKDAGIEPPGWWSADPDFRKPAQPRRTAGRFLRSPGPEAGTRLIEALRQPWDRAKPTYESWLRDERTFLDAAADPQFFVRNVHRIGLALLESPADAPLDRARTADALAREALQWAPYDGRLWSVRFQALLAEQRPAVAEALGWESTRLNPDDADACMQLALLLARQPARRAEAEALLRQTAARFPRNAAARTQLAELLILQDRAAEAAEVIAAAFADGATDGVTYGIQARLQAHAGSREAAAATLAEGRASHPENTAIPGFQRMLQRGEALPWHAGALLVPPPDSAGTDPDDPDLQDIIARGRLRRLAFRLAHPALAPDAPAELRAILATGEASPFARLLAARHGLSLPDADELTDFAIAFEAALHDEDRDRLTRLAERMAKLKALTLVGRALFGDTEAAWLIDEWLTEKPAGVSHAVGTLWTQLDRLRTGSDKPFAVIAAAEGDRLRGMVQDANEALLGDPLAAAA